MIIAKKDQNGMEEWSKKFKWIIGRKEVERKGLSKVGQQRDQQKGRMEVQNWQDYCEGKCRQKRIQGLPESKDGSVELLGKWNIELMRLIQ